MLLLTTTMSSGVGNIIIVVLSLDMSGTKNVQSVIRIAHTFLFNCFSRTRVLSSRGSIELKMMRCGAASSVTLLKRQCTYDENTHLFLGRQCLHVIPKSEMINDSPRPILSILGMLHRAQHFREKTQQRERAKFYNFAC